MAIKREKAEKTEMKGKLKEASAEPILTEKVKKDMGLLEFAGLENLDNLDPLNLAKFEKICVSYSEKIERMLENTTAIYVHIKASHKDGKQRRFELNIKAVSPTKVFTSSDTDWDIERVAHKVFKDVEKQIIHHFKSDTSYKKPY